jgi:hypothetical protein
MRNLISGIVGSLLGLLIVVGSAVSFATNNVKGGAYGAGQFAGFGFGVLLLVGGIVYLIIGIKEVNTEPKRNRKRKKTRQRRRREDDDD